MVAANSRLAWYQAIALPDLSNGFVEKECFLGQAFYVSLKTDVKLISLSPNSFTINKGEGTAEITQLDIAVPERKVKVTATNKVAGKVPLSEAELVVSAGRGLKGPENWGMIEELADLIGAATACSRAVADVHWNPSRTRWSNWSCCCKPLYCDRHFRAIQHLAGVNRSKVIVVINKILRLHSLKLQIMEL
jgi:electron transfer flavoprotein alpha subunit